MTLLDRYIGARVFGALLKTLFSLLCLFVLIDFLTERREDMTQFDVSAWTMLQYYFYSAPWFIARVAPLSMLVAVLIVVGSAAQSNEIVAGLSSGISLVRLLRLPLFIGALLGLVIFGMNEAWGAHAKRQALDIQARHFSRVKSAGRDGVDWPNLEGGWSCHIRKFNRRSLAGEDVLLYAIDETRLEEIRADRIFWDETKPGWILERGYWLIFETPDAPDTPERMLSSRISQVDAPFSETPSILFALEEDVESKGIAQLARDIDRSERLGIRVERLRVDLHAKVANAVVCFIMALLAIPFALRLRRGGVAVGLGAGIALALLYIMVSEAGKALGYMEVLGALPAAWLGNILFFLVGSVLFVRARA